MNRRLLATLFLSSSLSALTASSVAYAKGPTASQGPTTVSSLSSFVDGFRFGMTRAELTRAVIAPGGAIDKLYDPQLRNAAPGVQQRAIETERESVKSSFQRSTMEFTLSSPSGLDAGALGREYTYGNRESAMLLHTQGHKRYYFFINDKLWKVYDEFVLGSPVAPGNTFGEVEAKIATKLAAPPRRGDESGRTELDWQDSQVHLRVIDRSAERLVALVVEDRPTLNSLPLLRANQPPDPFAIDPSIVAVTKAGLSDPNKSNVPEEQPDDKASKKKKGKK